MQQTSQEPAQSALVLLDVASGQITTHIGAESRTFSGRLLWSPDSQRLANVSGNQTTLFAPADQSVVTTADCLSPYVNHVTWSPDAYNGRYAHGYVCVTNLAGETMRISAGGNASNPVWSADSQSLTLAVTTLPESAAFPDAPPRLPDPRLLRFDLATRQLTRITVLPQGTGAVVGWIQPSPDQQTIAIAYPHPDPILTLVDPTIAISTIDRAHAAPVVQERLRYLRLFAIREVYQDITRTAGLPEGPSRTIEDLDDLQRFDEALRGIAERQRALEDSQEKARHTNLLPNLQENHEGHEAREGINLNHTRDHTRCAAVHVPSCSSWLV